jgi:hypothetical protein
LSEPTPNETWDAMCRAARASKQAVEIVVQYEAPSEYAGRKLRLFYDPIADRRGHEWLD